MINSAERSDILVFNCYLCHIRFLLTCYVCSTKIGEISDISKCFENIVSQTLGVLTRIYAAELRNLIKEYIAMEYSVNYQDTTLQEAFLLYDIYTGGKNHDLWTPYITKPLTPLYQDCMDNILSDDEEKVKTLLSDMLEYHVKQSNNDSFVRSEFTFASQRVFPTEILALIHYRHTQGKSIDFIDDKILSVFVPYIKANNFRPSPAVEKARNDMYVLLGIG